MGEKVVIRHVFRVMLGRRRQRPRWDEWGDPVLLPVLVYELQELLVFGFVGPGQVQANGAHDKKKDDNQI
jgi:hypothetical protein